MFRPGRSVRAGSGRDEVRPVRLRQIGRSPRLRREIRGRAPQREILGVRVQRAPHDVERRARRRELVLLDVREPQEIAIARFPGAVEIPMQSVPSRMGELDRNAEIFVLCHHGKNSNRQRVCFRQIARLEIRAAVTKRKDESRIARQSVEFGNQQG